MSSRQMAKKVAFRFLLRTASSAVPSDRIIYPMESLLTGFPTMQQEVSNAGPKPAPKDESIFDVAFADDLAKHQENRRDEKDFSSFKVQFNTPSVPDHVRR
jgi:hypothetical protein